MRQWATWRQVSRSDRRVRSPAARAPPILAPVRLATWNVNSVVARLPRLVELARVEQPRCPLPAGDEDRGRRLPAGRGGGARLRGGAERRRTLERCRDHLASWPRRCRAWLRGCARVSGDRGARDERDVRRIASLVACTSPTDARSTTITTRTSSAGSARCASRCLPQRRTSPPLFICGDFNIAPTDDDVWDPAAFIGSTHVSAAGARGACGDHQRPRPR